MKVSRLRTTFCSTLLHLEPRARAGAESQSQSREPEPRAMQSREPEPRVRAGADQPRVRAGAVQKTRGSAYTRNHIAFSLSQSPIGLSLIKLQYCVSVCRTGVRRPGPLEEM